MTQAISATTSHARPCSPATKDLMPCLTRENQVDSEVNQGFSSIWRASTDMTEPASPIHGIIVKSYATYASNLQQ